MSEMYTGIFYVNAPTIGAETHLPFGGTKNTGNGHREACVQALEVFSEWKSIYIDYSGTLQRAQIDAQGPPPPLGDGPSHRPPPRGPRAIALPYFPIREYFLKRRGPHFRLS